MTVAEGKPGPSERLWLDEPDAEQQLERRTGDRRLRDHARQILRDGATVIRGAVPADVCEALRREYEDYCRNAASDEDVDAQGHHVRLSNFHLVSSAARQIGTNDRLMRVLDYFFGYRAAIYSSLTFEKSTEQELHRDSPYFHTLPPGFFFGVWTALETIDPAAGPLIYLRGGHRVELDPVDFVRTRYKGDEDNLSHRAYFEWQEAVARQAEAAGSQLVSPNLSKGDTMIWHPHLPHGGGIIKDPTLTRASIVFHCTPVNVPLYGPEVFFGFEEAKPIDFIPMVDAGDRLFVDHGAPQFFPDIHRDDIE